MHARVPVLKVLMDFKEAGSKRDSSKQDSGDMQENGSDIEAMILEEKRISAAECHDEAWAAGILAGIEPDIIAEMAIATALSALHRDAGEQAVLAMLDRIRDQVIQGDFDPDMRLH
jgi:hypothetical protein